MLSPSYLLPQTGNPLPALTNFLLLWEKEQPETNSLFLLSSSFSLFSPCHPDSKCKEQHEKWRHSSSIQPRKILLLLLYEAKNDKQENSVPPNFRLSPIPIPLALSVSPPPIHQQSKPHFSHLLPYYKCRYYKSAGHRVSKPAIYPLKSYADVANKPAHCPYSIPLQPQDPSGTSPHRNKAHLPRQHQTPLSKM